MGFNGFNGSYPLVNFHITMENHNFLLENPLFLWTLSIVFGMFTRPGISIISHRRKDTVVSTYLGEIWKSFVTSAPQARLTLARVQEDASWGGWVVGPRSSRAIFLDENRPRCEQNGAGICTPTRPPRYLCWFRFAPVTIVINTINHSYWSYKPI